MENKNSQLIEKGKKIQKKFCIIGQTHENSQLQNLYFY